MHVARSAGDSAATAQLAVAGRGIGRIGHEVNRQRGLRLRHSAGRERDTPDILGGIAVGTPLPRAAIDDQRVPGPRVQDEERVVATGQLHVAQGDIEIGVQRRRHVRAEAPYRVDRKQTALDLAAARVRLSVRDRDTRRTRQARVLFVPLISDAPRVEVYFHRRLAAGGNAQRRRWRRILRDAQHGNDQNRKETARRPHGLCSSMKSSLSGADGIRTHDPLVANQVLSQLSYRPPAPKIGARRVDG